MKITIIGAGIGGLTTAIALEQKGFDVEIFESFPAMKRMGAGIVIANNAMQVYKRLGLLDTIYKNSNPISRLQVVDENLNVLSKIKLGAFEKEYGVRTTTIHRGTLQDVLLKNLKTTTLHLGKRLQKISEENNQITLYFKDGSTHTTSTLIGADGINSAVRNHIFKKSTIRNAKQICWRGVTKMKLPERFLNELNESWGKGVRFGIVPLANEEVYWFAVASYLDDFKKEFEGVDLLKVFANFHPIVQQIISATPPDTIITNELNDLSPMQKWCTKNICLIGDAAHATTPNMGQGACQSIEDALALSICLEKEKNIEIAFQNFQNLRIKKANDIITQSWRVGKLAHLENGIGRRLRNFAMKMIPSSISSKQSVKIFELNF